MESNENSTTIDISKFKYYCFDSKLKHSREIKVKEQMDQFIKFNLMENSFLKIKNNIKNLNIILYNSFPNYDKKLINTTDIKQKYNLIRSIYNNLKNIKPLNSYSPIVPKNKFLLINYENFKKITEMLIFGFSYFIDGWNGNKNFTSLYTKKKNWEQITKSLETFIFFKYLNQVTELKISINNFDSGKDNSILDRVLLFTELYTFIFPFVDAVQFDMNIIKLNELYLKEEAKKNFYFNNNSTYIEQVATVYLKDLLANYLFFNKINNEVKRDIFHLTIEQYDSYIIEICQLFYKELNETEKNIPRDMANLLYYFPFFKPDVLYEFTAKINPLDSILFNNIMFIFFEVISNVEISEVAFDLFPPEMEENVNIRKMFLNKLYYKNTNEQMLKGYLENELYFKYQKNYNWNNEKDLVTISDDTILDILFEDFSENLNLFITLLEKNSQIFKVMKIRFLLPELLKSKLCYQAAVVYFILNCFLMLNRKLSGQKGSINIFHLETNAIMNSYLIDGIKKIKLKTIKINQCIFSIPEISKYIDFLYFPFNSIKSLTFSRISYCDLREVTIGLKSNMTNVKTLEQIEFNIRYEYEVDYEQIHLLFKDSIPFSVKDFKLSIPQELTYDELKATITNIVIGLVYSETIGKEINVNVNMCFESSNDDFSYLKFKEEIGKWFDFDNMNMKYLTSFKICNYSNIEESAFKIIEMQIVKIKNDDSTIKYIKNIIKKKNKELGNKASTFIFSYLNQPEQIINLSVIIDKNRI